MKTNLSQNTHTHTHTRTTSKQMSTTTCLEYFSHHLSPQYMHHHVCVYIHACACVSMCVRERGQTFNISNLSQQSRFVFDKRLVLCVQFLQSLQVNLLGCLVPRSQFVIIIIIPLNPGQVNHTHTLQTAHTSWAIHSYTTEAILCVLPNK